jgi:hypothetical protein
MTKFAGIIKNSRWIRFSMSLTDLIQLYYEQTACRDLEERTGPETVVRHNIFYNAAN